MDGNATLTRRQFIVTAATAAGGLAIGLATGPSAFAATAGAQPWSSEGGHNPHDLDAFIAIESDDSVLIRYVRSEMGQGSMTALPMIVTEELQCDWLKVRVEYAGQPQRPREQGLWRYVLVRQPLGQVVAREDAAGGGERARAADCRRRGALARAAAGLLRRQRHRDACRNGAHGPLRPACRRRGDDHACQRAGD